MSLAKLVEKLLPAKKINIFGKDSLMMTSFPYYLLTLILVMSYSLLWNHAWSVMMFIYVLMPLLDEICTQDTRNPNEQQRKYLQENDIFFQIPLYTAIILDWMIFFKVMRHFSQFEFTFWNCYNIPAFFFIASTINAFQFGIAHIIFHKPGLFNQVIAVLQLSKNLYIHYAYEHVLGHHRRVATPEDPCSAPQGYSLYKFFPRTFFGCYKSVYDMQKDIDQKPFFLNCAVLSVAGAIAFTLGIYYLYNLQTTIFFVLQAFLAIVTLQSGNYLEHYGLRRKKLPNGEYQKVTIQHSWNAPHRFSNYLLFKLQRHSDHHQNAMKPYQTLLLPDQSPHLPHGYSLIMFLSFNPSQWSKIMDPLTDEYNKLKMGPARNEAIEKAVTLSKAFAVDLGLKLTVLWLISLLQLL